MRFRDRMGGRDELRNRRFAMNAGCFKNGMLSLIPLSTHPMDTVHVPSKEPGRQRRMGCRLLSAALLAGRS